VVKTKSRRACPVCGTPFTGELCPVCVLHGALGNEQTVNQSVGPTLSPSEFRFERYEVLTSDALSALANGDSSAPDHTRTCYRLPKCVQPDHEWPDPGRIWIVMAS
jgi:hypothetical protein